MRYPDSDYKAITLLADHLFSPALLLAERIERGLIHIHGRTVIELGAGCALPSLLASTLPLAPALVVVTDYPDTGIITNLRANVRANELLVHPGCSVLYQGHEWGADVKPLIDLLPHPSGYTGYDVVLLSDLLHFHTSHSALTTSLTSLLARTRTSRAYVATGTYTTPEICDSFFRGAAEAGVLFKEGDRDGLWQGRTTVNDLSVEQMGVRKGTCRWWMGEWADAVLQNAGDSAV